MTDNEFKELLKCNLTMSVTHKYNWGKPYVEIRLELISEEGNEPEVLSTIRIDSSDLKEDT